MKLRKTLYVTALVMILTACSSEPEKFVFNDKPLQQLTENPKVISHLSEKDRTLLASYLSMQQLAGGGVAPSVALKSVEEILIEAKKWDALEYERHQKEKVSKYSELYIKEGEQLVEAINMEHADSSTQNVNSRFKGNVGLQVLVPDYLHAIPKGWIGLEKEGLVLLTSGEIDNVTAKNIISIKPGTELENYTALLDVKESFGIVAVKPGETYKIFIKFRLSDSK